MPGVSGAFETEDSGPRKRGSVKRTSSHDSDGTDEGVNGFEDDERFPFKTSLIGKFWVTSVVMQLALYVTCYVGATMELDEVLPDQEEVLPDGSLAGSPAAEIETSATGAHASNFETFVYIGIFWILLFQVKEIAPHVRAAGENELAYLKSESLQEKMTAMKRLKWHQRMCFIPQPLMALDALVGSMGMGGLLFRYASRSGCAKGIVDGLGQLDAKGWIMILVMLISVTVIITLLFICTRIHFAHFQAVNNTEAAQEYLQDKLASQGLTPRSGGAKSSRGLLWWYLLSVALQMLLVAMLSFAKESVAAKDDAESVGMAKGLFVLMAIGVFYLGHQVGQASGYITESGALNMADQYAVTRRIEWHNRNMFSPVFAAILQSFVIFPSSFALLPFFTAEGSVCHPKDGLFGNVDNMSGNAVFGFGVAFIAFAVLQVVLLQISVMHFRAIKRMHH